MGHFCLKFCSQELLQFAQSGHTVVPIWRTISSTDHTQLITARNIFHRTETFGHRALAGDEHALQVLVLLPQRELQQEDVRRVQGVGVGGRCRRLPVSLVNESNDANLGQDPKSGVEV